MSELQELYYKNMSSKLNTTNSELTEEQNKAYNIMALGKNIFMTGPAGSGKSYCIKLFTQVYSNSRKIAITSTTGISALLIGGTTLHSYLGIGLGKGSIEAITTNIFKRSYLRKKWNELETLIIDEVSMLSYELFDKLENIARIVRHNEEPFGGIQLILSGDFCQLPCIENNSFCCESKSWEKCIKNIVYFKNIIRQGDLIFQNCLNNIRIGKIDKDIEEILQSRVGIKLENNFGIKPTKIYPLNYAVNYVNEEELDKLALSGSEFYEYELEITVYPYIKNKFKEIEKFKKYCPVPNILHLCIGAQVMLLHNLDLENELANGSRGVITGFVDEKPKVKFLNGISRIIDYHIWEVEENDKKILKGIQIPLKLAYAISIHKSQGISLDYAEIDLSEIFEFGQAYVGLSRVRSLEGLSIIKIDIDKIKAHPFAIEYYKNLEKLNK